MKIGLTGNIGSGKSTVAQLFSTFGIPIFFADEIGRSVLNDPAIHPKLHALFGSTIFDPQTHTPDRKKMASIVFSNPDYLQQLNAIVHPEVSKRFLQWCDLQTDTPYVIMESAIIFESNLESLFDRIIMVSADENIRLQRVMKRDNCSEIAVRARMLQQLSENEKIARADYVIKNNERDLLLPKTLTLHQQFVELSHL